MAPVKLPPSSFRAVLWIYQEKEMSLFLVHQKNNTFGLEGLDFGGCI